MYSNTRLAPTRAPRRALDVVHSWPTGEQIDSRPRRPDAVVLRPVHTCLTPRQAEIQKTERALIAADARLDLWWDEKESLTRSLTWRLEQLFAADEQLACFPDGLPTFVVAHPQEEPF